MDSAVWLRSILKTLLLPPTGLLLIAIVGVAMLRRHPRTGHVVAYTALAILLALSTPVVSQLLVASLHPPRPFAANRVSGAGAVVILGGGMRREAPEYGGEDTLNALTLERVRYGARVVQQTGLPIMVSGGRPQEGSAEAELMRRVLEDEFKMPVRWMEPDSLNTHENAVRSARILQSAGIRKIVLVTHAFDMLRASAEFADAGIESVPAATNLPRANRYELTDWLPGMNGLQLSYYAIYEILANVARLIVPSMVPSIVPISR